MRGGWKPRVQIIAQYRNNLPNGSAPSRCYNAYFPDQELLLPDMRISLWLSNMFWIGLGSQSEALIQLEPAISKTRIPGSDRWKTPNWLPCWSVAVLPAIQLPGKRSRNAIIGVSTTFVIGLQVRPMTHKISRKRSLSRCTAR